MVSHTDTSKYSKACVGCPDWQHSMYIASLLARRHSHCPCLTGQLGAASLDPTECFFPWLVLICVLSLLQVVTVTVTAFSMCWIPSGDLLILRVVWGVSNLQVVSEVSAVLEAVPSNFAVDPKLSAKRQERTGPSPSPLRPPPPVLPAPQVLGDPAPFPVSHSASL